MTCSRLTAAEIAQIRREQDVIARRLHQILMRTYRASYRGGNRAALLQAVATCARYGWRVPAWAAIPFGRAVDATLRTYRHASWDQAFGKPHPAGKHIDALKRDSLDWMVFTTVEDLRRAGHALDPATFARAGKRVARQSGGAVKTMKATKVRELYYGARRQFVRNPHLEYFARKLPKLGTDLG